MLDLWWFIFDVCLILCLWVFKLAGAGVYSLCEIGDDCSVYLHVGFVLRWFLLVWCLFLILFLGWRFMLFLV